MREFKFRAWDNNHKAMHYSGDCTLDWLFELPERHGGQVMQYTGLKDKNGKEIYEGDIVRVYTYQDDDEPSLNDFTLHRVEWGDDYPAFDLVPGYGGEYNMLQEAAGDPGGEGYAIEVVGNIHETPELVENKRFAQ